MTDPRLRHAPIELRAVADGPEGVLRGYASVYDTQYRIGHGLKEEIAPNAFAASLASREGVVPVFYQHNWDAPVGVATATEDQHGVHVEARLFIEENELARSVWMAAKAGALREWSVGFYPSEIETRSAEGTEVERVTVADLAEASIVVRGANPLTEMLEVRTAEATPEPEVVPEPEVEETPFPDYIAESMDQEHVRAWFREDTSPE